jgi:hypothetical protein
MRSAPACAVRAASREIPAELAAHVFIVPITVAIVAVHPHVPPPVTMMPRHSMPVLGPTDTLRAGVGIQVSCGHGKWRRSERRLLDAGMGQCLSYNGRCGQRKKRNESERRQDFAHRRFPWLAGEALPERSTARTRPAVTAKVPTWLQIWWHRSRGCTGSESQVRQAKNPQPSYFGGADVPLRGSGSWSGEGSPPKSRSATTTIAATPSRSGIRPRLLTTGAGP